jgi:hypothetical protein
MTHPFFAWKNGADINTLQLVRQLRTRGVEAELHVLGVGDDRGHYDVDGESVRVTRLDVPAEWAPLALARGLEAELRAGLARIIAERAPDAVFVPWGDTALAHQATQMHPRVGVFIQNGGAVGPGTSPSAYAGIDLFTVSPMMQRKCKKFLRRDAMLLYNRVEPETVVATDGPRDRIGMVNICGDKGAVVFLTVAANLREQSFVATGGWKGLAEKYATMTTNLANVEIVPPTDDMRTFYRQLRMLLVPSLCIDAFPRVAIEAQMNGIPVVCTDRCGVKQVVSSLIVKTAPKPAALDAEEYYRRADLNVSTVRGFLDAILTVDEPDNHAELSARALEQAAEYTTRQERTVDAFASWVSRGA